MSVELKVASIAAVSSLAVALITTFGTANLANRELTEQIAIAQNIAKNINEQVPVGSIYAFAGPYNEEVGSAGWLPCDGQAISRSKYPKFFAAVGETWGKGDGVNTVNLPDLRGVFLRGLDGSRGLDPDSAERSQSAHGGNIGNQVGSFQADATAMPKVPFTLEPSGNHAHSFGASRSNGTGSGAPLGHGDTNPNEYQHGTNSQGTHSHQISSGGDAETRPANVYVTYIVKVR